MKKAVIILLVVSAMIALTFTGCAGGKPEDGTTRDTKEAAPAESGKTQRSASEAAVSEWVRLDVPEGYKAVKESDQYVTVENESNGKQFVRIAYDYLMGRDLEMLQAEKISNDPGKYSKGADGFFSGMSWKVVNYVENGLDCRIFFADAGDGEHLIRVTAVGLTENDFALQVIMGGMIINTEKL